MPVWQGFVPLMGSASRRGGLVVTPDSQSIWGHQVSVILCISRCGCWPSYSEANTCSQIGKSKRRVHLRSFAMPSFGELFQVLTSTMKCFWKSGLMVVLMETLLCEKALPRITFPCVPTSSLAYLVLTLFEA